MSHNTPAYRGRSAAFGAAMQRSAERRRCPACDRKSALATHQDEFGRVTYCSWCDYERGYDAINDVRWEKHPGQETVVINASNTGEQAEGGT